MSMREATRSDMASILENLKEFHEWSGITKWASWESSVQHWGKWLYERILDPLSLVLVAEHEGNVFGLLVATIVHSYWNPSVKLAMENVLWVDPDYRGHFCATELVKRFEVWSKDYGVVGTTGGAWQLATDISPFWLARGYKPCEANFIKEA